MSHTEREARPVVEPSETDEGIPDCCVRELEKYLAALERGEQPDREQLIVRFPEHAVHLRDRLDSLEWIWRLAPQMDTAGEGLLNHWLEANSRRLGDFRIIREIGRGGMGVVYQAEQVSTGRSVALKVLPYATVLDKRQLVRFKNEARVAATLKHPHIVPVYDVGADQGIPYYAMLRIEGCSLAKVVSELRSSALAPGSGSSAVSQQLRESIRLLSCDTGSAEYFCEVARLGVQAAEALDYAHEAGIVHRDIKPANLLIDHSGDLFVTDFGLAHIENEVGITKSGDLLGTVRYMSPEQAGSEGRCVDRRTDIYSLGATLYELLTLQRAVTGTTREQMIQQIVAGEPRKLRLRNRAIPVELETIVSKAMSRYCHDRYASARDLAEDLRRFLTDKPIIAKRPTLRRLATGWCRRHVEVLAPLVAALVAALATGVIVTALAWYLEREHRWIAEQTLQRAEQSEAETQQLLYASNIKLANQAWQEGDLSQFLELLNRCVPRQGSTDLRGFEWHYLKQRLHNNRVSLVNHLQAVYHICYSPDGRSLAVVGEDALIRIFNLQTFREEVVMATGQGEVNGLAFSPAGTVIASAGDDGTVRIWDLATGLEVRKIRAHAGEVFNVLFTDDGNLLVTCGNEPTIRIWDAHTGMTAGTLDGHQRAVEAIVLSSDGRTLASASSDETAKLWDLTSRRELRTLTGHDGRLTCVAISPDGQMIATGSIDKTVGFWDVQQGTLIAQGQQLDEIQSIAFAADSRLLATGDRTGTVRIWNVPRVGQTTDSLLTLLPSDSENANLLQGHKGRVYSIVFSHDSNQLISAGADGQLIIWSLNGAPAEIELQPTGIVDDLVYASNGQVAVASQNGVYLQDTTTGDVIKTLADDSHRWQSLAVSPTGLLAAGSKSGAVAVWNLAAGEKVQSWELGEPVDRGQMALAPDGEWLAIASWQHADGAVRLFDVGTGEVVNTFAAKLANVVAFSAGGAQLVADSQNDLFAWNVASGRRLRRLAGHTSTIKALAVSSDGRLLVSSGKDRTVKLWDTATGHLLASLPGHRDAVWAAACAPDGRSFITADQSGVMIVRQLATGHELLKLEPRPQPIDKLAISPDGRELAYLLEGGATRVIRLKGEAE